MNPIWTQFWVGLGPQGPNLGWIGSGWAPRVQIWAESGRVGRDNLAVLLAISLGIFANFPTSFPGERNLEFLNSPNEEFLFSQMLLPKDPQAEKT